MSFWDGNDNAFLLLFQKHIEGTVLEYFEHGDSGEVVAALEDLPLGQRKYKVPTFTIPIYH